MWLLVTSIIVCSQVVFRKNKSSSPSTIEGSYSSCYYSYRVGVLIVVLIVGINYSCSYSCERFANNVIIIVKEYLWANHLFACPPERYIAYKGGTTGGTIIMLHYPSSLLDAYCICSSPQTWWLIWCEEIQRYKRNTKINMTLWARMWDSY